MIKLSLFPNDDLRQEHGERTDHMQGIIDVLYK